MKLWLFRVISSTFLPFIIQFRRRRAARDKTNDFSMAICPRPPATAATDTFFPRSPSDSRVRVSSHPNKQDWGRSPAQTWRRSPSFSQKKWLKAPISTLNLRHYAKQASKTLKVFVKLGHKGHKGRDGQFGYQRLLKLPVGYEFFCCIPIS